MLNSKSFSNSTNPLCSFFFFNKGKRALPQTIVSIAIISSNIFDTSAFLFIILALEKPIHTMFGKAYIYVYFLQAWTHEEFPKVRDPSRANFVGAL